MSITYEQLRNLALLLDNTPRKPMKLYLQQNIYNQLSEKDRAGFTPIMPFDFRSTSKKVKDRIKKTK